MHSFSLSCVLNCKDAAGDQGTAAGSEMGQDAANAHMRSTMGPSTARPARRRIKVTPWIFGGWGCGCGGGGGGRVAFQQALSVSGWINVHKHAAISYLLCCACVMPVCKRNMPGSKLKK